MLRNLGLEERLHVLHNNYRMHGLQQTLRDVLGAWLGRPLTDHFDRKYGVETAHGVPTDNAGIADQGLRANAVRYSAIAEPVMRHFLREVTPDIGVADYTFIDLGCGKGRALIMASELPFREVIGVELSPAHCATARENWQRARANLRYQPRCERVSVHCVSASEFEFPAEPLLIYMFRPFFGPVFRQVLDRLSETKDRFGKPVWIGLCHPQEEFVLQQHPRFILRREHQVIAENHSWNLWECLPAAH